MAIIQNIRTDYGYKSYWRLASKTEDFDAEGASGIKGALTLKFVGYTNEDERREGFKPSPIPITVILHDHDYKRDMTDKEIYQTVMAKAFVGSVGDEAEPAPE